MKKLQIFGLILLATFLVSVTNVDAYVSVKGYYRKNGTYVAPYTRSNPNGLKSDNYGYKPSQGIYNPTYGTRGSEWDTPTTITDPNYYEGKALYESGKGVVHGANIFKTSTTAGNLTIGSQGNAVISLQTFLINKNIGSANLLVADGNFGRITRKALAEYQLSVGIHPALGYYGSITSAYISTHP